MGRKSGYILTHLTAMPMPDASNITRQTYERAAQAMLDALAPKPLAPYASHHAHLISRFAGRPSMRALTMGFGAATMIRQFADDGAAPVGLDFSPSALMWLRRQTHAPLVCADIRRLPFARSNFDAIYADALLGHIARSEFDETVRGIRDALRPGGVLGVRLKLGEGEGLHSHKSGKGQVWRTYWSQKDFIERLYALDFDLRHEQVITAAQQVFLILRREY